MKIESITTADANTWDHAWETCDYATYFHSREWAELWQRYSAGDYRAEPRALRFADGRTAVIPLVRRRIAAGVISTYFSSPAGTYGGWVSADELRPEHAAAATQYLCGRVPNVTWRINPYDPNAPAASDVAAEDDHTHALELSSDFDAIFKTWSKGHRAAVKQSQREGITARLADGIEDWRAYYDAYEDSLRRWGDSASMAYRWEFFEALERMASPHVRLWLAMHDDRVAAGALCFYAKRHVVYWHGAAHSEYFKMRPVNLLVYSAVRDACGAGYRWFDFNPSGGLDGVRSFKKSFGTSELSCPVVRRESATLRLLKKLRGR